MEKSHFPLLWDYLRYSDTETVHVYQYPFTPLSSNNRAWDFSWVYVYLGFPGVSGKEFTCQGRTWQEIRIQSLGWEDSLEEQMATHSSILARRIPWSKEPGGLPSMGSHRLGHDWNDFAAAAAAAAAAVHRYQRGLEQSGRITQVTVKQYFST